MEQIAKKIKNFILNDVNPELAKLADQTVTLPPMPEREELPEVTSIKDMAVIISKQEALIESWESWGKNVKGIVEGENPDDSK